MAPRRKSHGTLALSRIYIKRQRYYYFSAQPILNPWTGKLTKWHSLCSLKEGELKAREKTATIQRNARAHTAGQGDMPEYVNIYLTDLLRKRDKKRPAEIARQHIFNIGTSNLKSSCAIIARCFEDFNIDQPIGYDVAQFIDQWAGRRSAQIYLARLSDFFRWSIRRGLRTDNPCANIRAEKPEPRRRYLTDAEWSAVRDALLVGDDGKRTASGPMVQVYIDLCYLLYQRTTEIRLLKWSQIDHESAAIRFTPTKTERSSGLSVEIPITPSVHEALDRARQLDDGKSIYVVHTGRGQPYTANGIGSAWRRACVRAGVENATLRDIRAKAATDAKKLGYTRKEISIGLAHTDEGMTQHYLRGRDAERSTVELILPSKKAN